MPRPEWLLAALVLLPPRHAQAQSDSLSVAPYPAGVGLVAWGQATKVGDSTVAWIDGVPILASFYRFDIIQQWKGPRQSSLAVMQPYRGDCGFVADCMVVMKDAHHNYLIYAKQDSVGRWQVIGVYEGAAAESLTAQLNRRPQHR